MIQGVSPLLEDLLRDYEITKRSSGYSEDTIGRVRTNMRRVARDIKIQTINQLTTSAVLEWGEQRRSAGLSQSGLYAAYNSIRSFLKFLEMINVQYPAERKRIYCKPNYKDPECLRPEEIRKIVQHARYDIAILIRLLYTGGMRISEGLPLTPDDLRHDNTIFINGKWCESRTVFITPDLRQEMIWMAKDGAYCFRDDKDPSKHMNRKTAYYRIKKAMVAAGFPKAYPHSLRHGFTTTLIREGVNTSKVQRLLGHKNITTTQRYEHLVTDDLKQAHAQFLVKV